MRKFDRFLLSSVLGVAIAGGGYIFLGGPLTEVVQAHLKDHPKLEKAFNALKEAKEYVESYPTDFHGHRVEALHAIHVAQDKIALCVEDAEKKAAVDSVRVVPLEDRHIKLHDAVFALKEAHDYMAASKEDFRGHKEEALKAIDEAIKQLEGLIAD